MSMLETKSGVEDQESAWQSPNPTNEFEYRSISKTAIASCVFAVLGLASPLNQAFVLLPLLGACFGIVAILTIRKYPEEMIGEWPAKIGLIASSVLFVLSIGWHSYVYATEVPDGYQRIAFWDLKDNTRTALPFSEKAMELDGKRVFLKGYVRPGAKRKNLQDFIMVGDFGDCCFGGNPDVTEIVEINIQTDDRVDHTLSLRKIGGVFRLNKASKPVDEEDIPRVFYQIEAGYVR